MYRKPESNKGIETKTPLFKIPAPRGSSSIIGSNLEQREDLL